MTRLFISHSSKDNRFAEKLRRDLAADGYQSIFLDFYPDDGIDAGQRWSDVIHRNLKACDALVVLCSPAMECSNWCFAEIALAKTLGKHIFPVQICSGAVRHQLLHEYQFVDASLDWSDGVGRLTKGMRRMGLDPKFSLAWDDSRPPYPGLEAFSEEDAGVFFGRTEEIRKTASQIYTEHLRNEVRFSVVFGPSGSGKSSFVRAGLLPQLKRDSKFILTRPMRPGSTPLESLSHVLSEASDREFQVLYNALSKTDTPAILVEEICRDIIQANKNAGTQVLLFVDQWEELFAPHCLQAGQFCDLLSESLKSTSRLNVVATLRTDFLLDAQISEIWLSHKPQLISLDAIPRSRFADVIEEPARRSGLKLERGLVAEILDDAGDSSSLPILAFALRELFEKDKSTGVLSVSTYRHELGGLGGAISQCVSRVQAELSATRQELALRNILLRLVDIRPEDGRYTRVAMPRNQFDPKDQALLEELLRARILSMRFKGTTEYVEVAHESLFKAWPILAKWLEEATEILIFLRDLKPQTNAWSSSEQSMDRSPFLLTGATLAAGRNFLLEQPEDLLRFDPIAYDLIVESELYFEQDSKEKAKRKSRWISALVAILVMTLLASLLGISLLIADSQRRKADFQRQQADLQRAQAEKDRISTQIAGIRLTQDSAGYQQRLNNPGVSAVLLAQAVVDADQVDEGLEDVLRTALAAATSRLLKLRNIIEIGSDSRGCAISPLGDVAVVGNSKGMLFHVDLNLCELTTTSPIIALPTASIPAEQLTLAKGITDIAFHPSGSFYAVSTASGRIHIIDAVTRQRQTYFDHSCWVMSVAFNSDGTKLLVAGHTDPANHPDPSCLAIYDVESLECTSRFEVNYDLYIARFLDEGDQVVAAGGVAPFPALSIWSSSDLRNPLETVVESTARIFTLSNRPAHPGEFTTGDVNGDVILWKRRPEWTASVLTKHGKQVRSVSWDKSGTFLLVGGEDSIARVWNANTLRPVGQQLLHRGQVRSGALDIQTGRAITVDFDEGVHVWEVESNPGRDISLNHPGPVWDCDFDELGTRVITAFPSTSSEAGGAYVWNLDGKRVAALLHGSDVMVSRFRPGKQQAITCGNDGVVKLWDVTTEQPVAPAISNDRHLFYTGEFVSPNLFATAGRGSKIRLFSFDQNSEHLTVSSVLEKPTNSFIWRLGIGPAGELVADGGNHLLYWPRPQNPSSAPLKLQLPKGDEDRATETVFGGFGSDGKKVLALSTDGSATIWDCNSTPPTAITLDKLSENPGRLNACWNPLRDIIAISNPEGKITLWTSSGKRWSDSELVHPSKVECLDISPDGRWLATGCSDGGMRLWNIDRGIWTGLSSYHDAPITKIKFSPNNRTILTASRDGTARLVTIPDPIDGSASRLLAVTEAVAGIKITRTGTGASAAALAPQPLSRQEFLERIAVPKAAD